MNHEIEADKSTRLVLGSDETRELIAAARAVVDAYYEEIPGVGSMSTEEIERLRRALP